MSSRTISILVIYNNNIAINNQIQLENQNEKETFKSTETFIPQIFISSIFNDILTLKRD